MSNIASLLAVVRTEVIGRSRACHAQHQSSKLSKLNAEPWSWRIDAITSTGRCNSPLPPWRTRRDGPSIILMHLIMDAKQIRSAHHTWWFSLRPLPTPADRVNEKGGARLFSFLSLMRRELNTFCTPFPPAEKRSAPHLQRTKVEHHHPARWIWAPWMRSWSANQLANFYYGNFTSTSSVKLLASPNKHHTWWHGSARTNCNPGHPIIQKTVALRCLFWSFMLSLVLGLLHKQRAPMNWTTCFWFGATLDMSSSQASSCLVVCENTLLARMYLYHPLSPNLTERKPSKFSRPKGWLLGH